MQHKTIYFFPIYIILVFINTADIFSFNVVVSIKDQITYVYDHEKLIRKMVCSTGIPDTENATPVGDFIINESGQKRGEWFFSDKLNAGAKYWVGFVGGTYLFHSVPLTNDKQIILEEFKKLGTPASHGCVRLGMDDAFWFYNNIPDGTLLKICFEYDPDKAFYDIENIPENKEEVSAWLAGNMNKYKQRYTLSCEIALMRMSLALMGIPELSEDDILSIIPTAGKDPEKSFVCDNIRGGRRNTDGSIHWDNYGAHPPVLEKFLSDEINENGLADNYYIAEMKADDDELRDLMVNNSQFVGAIVWLVGHPDRWGYHPPVNERGMVLGEHVRFLDPVLDVSGNFRLWDPETGKVVVSKEAGVGRDCFSYRIVGIFKN